MNTKELQLVLSGGEGYCTEFKENLTHLDREMTAFANSSGGYIYIGISDNKVVKGIEITNKLKSQIIDTARNCDPPIQVLLEEFKNILIVEVREGTDKPYRCSSGFYNRIGPNSQKMNRDEILAFVKSEGKIRFDEIILKEFTEEDFDENKFDAYLDQAKITKVLDKNTILKNLHIVEIQQGRCYYCNTAVLFFAKNLSAHYYHTAVTCALYKGYDKVTVLDRKDFNRDIVSNIDDALLYLKQHLKVRYQFDGTAQRKDIPELPFEALREAVVNAVTHRDYFLKEANVMVEIFDDRIEITSPGGLPKGLKFSQFGSESLLRNPNIANLLHRINYIEKLGTGIQRIKKSMQEAGLPKVKFDLTDFVKLTFYRETVQEKIPAVNTAYNYEQFVSDSFGYTPNITGKASDNRRITVGYRRIPSDCSEQEQAVIEYLFENRTITSKQVEKLLALKESRTRELLHTMVKKEYLVKHGNARNTYYKLAKAADNE